MPSNHLILCHLLLLLPSIFPSIRIFSIESVLHIRWPKIWSFSFSISPSNEYSGLMSFRIDWFDLLAVQGTLKCLLQHHSSTSQYSCNGNIKPYTLLDKTYFTFIDIHLYIYSLSRTLIHDYTIVFLIPSPADRHLGCFQLEVIKLV